MEALPVTLAPFTECYHFFEPKMYLFGASFSYIGKNSVFSPFPNRRERDQSWRRRETCLERGSAISLLLVLEAEIGICFLQILLFYEWSLLWRICRSKCTASETYITNRESALTCKWNNWVRDSNFYLMSKYNHINHYWLCIVISMLSMLLCHEQIWREILFKPLFLAFVIAKKKKRHF